MSKNLHRWLGGYISKNLGRAFKPIKVDGPTHIMLTVCDHYEPDWGGADAQHQLDRITRWVNDYPTLVNNHFDADGCHPRHSFFSPAEVYKKENLDLLSGLVHAGYGEVEVHLHHRDDTEETLKAQLEKAKDDFSSHGFLSRRKLSGHLRFGFIHGNWSLNNSRCDGDWCGVNDELRILHELGCYADFTYPSAPSETQPKKINSIYYANSNATKSKGHNTGVDAQVGKFRDAHMLMVQGPLALNWKNRVRGIFPRIENADLTGHYYPTSDRVDLWIDQHIHVKGKPEWIFIKLHTHGAKEDNATALLGKPMDELYRDLSQRYNDGTHYKLHYTSAREMYNIIKAAEAGESGQPGEYRNYILEKNQ